ncbi:N-acetylmuramoyl-L-alanine amidase [Lyngbya confervoides]|uniref:N-acetylmuramoyl-L-alanine amidase n=1 Tax=Lyngbya confervoides BDU141951 TaxID=1574623 RepID=A0ABD4T5R0_9CYAN|nr:N-acetylmuramoyl-L-alanine amidase [Lyngbya confervoides]MCM1983869.1 N-acetylmuramoyl-L-alanine amidase [Lyngbya confervoides BDU141951]
MLPSLLGGWLWTEIAQAAELQFWRFEPAQNRLVFSTDVSVQPQVQLIPDPTRLVVDLPGIQLRQPTVRQSLSGTVRSVRVGQFDNFTTRIVVELDPAYVVDPNQVKVEGTSGNNWSIALPTPQRIGSTLTRSPVSPEAVQTPILPSPPSPAQRATPPRDTAPPEISARPDQPGLEDISITQDGLFFKTTGNTPEVSVQRSRNRRQVVVTLRGLTANPELTRRTFNPDYFGIQQLKVRQSQNSPSQTEVVLDVSRSSPNWFASVSRFGGVSVLPQVRDRAPRPTSTVSLLQGETPQAPAATSLAQVTQVRAVQLGGDQMLVQADRPISYLTAWEGSQYRLTIRAAQLASGVQPPRVGLGSPLSAVQFRQDQTGLSILSTPATGVRIVGVQRRSSDSIILRLARAGSPASTVQIPTPAPTPTAPTTPLPRPGRKVVVIDPGHGGRDPGAIGINGLRETNVVLPISLDVSRILQQQGLTVYLTRTDEREIDLEPRVSLAERVRADVFVSIHANAISMSRPDVNGLETYYAPGSSAGARLAQSIHNSVLGSINMGDRGVRSARFYVIRRTSMPAALVETGFVTGAIDNPRLADPAFRRQMAEAIARGILRYLSGS